MLRGEEASFFMSPLTNPFHWNLFSFFKKKNVNVDSLKVLFKEVSLDVVFNFLKEIYTFLVKNIHLFF